MGPLAIVRLSKAKTKEAIMNGRVCYICDFLENQIACSHGLANAMRTSVESTAGRRGRVYIFVPLCD